MNRSAKDKKSAEPDFSKPLNLAELEKFVDGDDCFGSLWDLRAKECPMCADKEMCGVLYNENLRRKVKEFEQEEEVIMLDRSDFEALDGIDAALINGDVVGDVIGMQVGDFIDAIMSKANTSDEEAAVLWAKRFIKRNRNIYTKSGIICKR